MIVLSTVRTMYTYNACTVQCTLCVLHCIILYFTVGIQYYMYTLQYALSYQMIEYKDSQQPNQIL